MAGAAHYCVMLVCAKSAHSAPEKHTETGKQAAAPNQASKLSEGIRPRCVWEKTKEYRAPVLFGTSLG